MASVTFNIYTWSQQNEQYEPVGTVSVPQDSYGRGLLDVQNAFKQLSCTSPITILARPDMSIAYQLDDSQPCGLRQWYQPASLLAQDGAERKAKREAYLNSLTPCPLCKLQVKQSDMRPYYDSMGYGHHACAACVAKRGPQLSGYYAHGEFHPY